MNLSGSDVASAFGLILTGLFGFPYIRVRVRAKVNFFFDLCSLLNVNIQLDSL